ncbi:hypothetical protein KC335_g9 [Hortaea werneckii]|nr:hypothetical protein KC335_g9 [Hortaea werneckii]
MLPCILLRPHVNDVVLRVTELGAFNFFQHEALLALGALIPSLTWANFDLASCITLLCVQVLAVGEIAESDFPIDGALNLPLLRLVRSFCCIGLDLIVPPLANAAAVHCNEVVRHIQRHSERTRVQIGLFITCLVLQDGSDPQSLPWHGLLLHPYRAKIYSKVMYCLQVMKYFVGLVSRAFPCSPSVDDGAISSCGSLSPFLAIGFSLIHISIAVAKTIRQCVLLSKSACVITRCGKRISAAVP